MIKLEAATRLMAAMPTTTWRTKNAHGYPAMTLEEAGRKGFTEGPYYHGTNKRNFAGIMEKGFRSKGAPSWQHKDYGYIEEWEKWGTVDPVMFTPNRADAAKFGKHIVTCYVKPGRTFSADKLTLFGGLYVKHPADIVPILPEQ